MNTTSDQVRTGADDERSVGALLKELAREVPSLVSSEVALLKAEAQETLRSTRAGVAAVSTGGAVMMAGLVILLLAGVYALSNVMEPWLAALIIGLGAMLVGHLMVKSGQKKFDAGSLTPERTLHSLQKDKDAISGRTP